MLSSFLFLTSGLFLGWSIGANHTSHFWGTAVGTKMVKFSTAAILCSIFVVIGAVFGGQGTSSTLANLGHINMLPGAFIVAFATAFTAFNMTKLGLPISTSQALIGAIIGWNLYSQISIDTSILGKIASTWIISPLLAAVSSFIIYNIVRVFINHSKIHIIKFDKYTRWGLIIVGIIGSYALGANNIGNVVGIFLNSNPFTDINLFNIFNIQADNILFFIGGLSITIGVMTYSKKVMSTVGSDLFHLSPISALIVVFSVSMTMFLFTSTTLHNFLNEKSLPTLPLVPISSAQAIIGAIIGISVARKNYNINTKLLFRILLGWIISPIASVIICYLSLFFMENVFLLQVK